MAECKSKWGSLRNSYNRAVREGRDTASGSKGSKKRKWYLMDAMEFLRDFVGVHRKLGSNTMGTNSEENLAETVEPDLVDTISTENLEENLHSAVIQTHEFENVSSPASQPSRRKSTSVEKVVDPMISFLKSRTKVSEQENPTLTFFKSLIPDVEKLTESRKRKFKQTVLNELYRHLDEQENFAYFNTPQLPIPSPIPSSSSSEAPPPEPYQYAYTTNN